MLTKKKSNVDETLAVVRDLTKFKKRIEELAKAEKSANDAVAVATAKIAEINIKMDLRVAEANKKVKAGQDLLVSREAGVADLTATALEAQGEATRHEKALTKRAARLEQDRAKLKADKAAFKDEAIGQAKKAQSFENAAKAACALMKGTDHG